MGTDRKTGRFILSRRELLRLAFAAPLLPRAARAFAEPAADRQGLTLEALAKAPARVVAVGQQRAPEGVRLTRTWNGGLCRSSLTNTGKQALRIQQVVLFDVSHALPPHTAFYGEGFQMLSQTGGSLGAPENIGNFTDAAHYKLPQPVGARVVYGLMTLTPPGGDAAVLGFTSCRRFSGQFSVRTSSFEVVVDTEGLELAPGETWDLEELSFGSGPQREALLESLATRIAEHHPPLRTDAPPSGWCSWYCFGSRVTAKQVLDNLEVISKTAPGLRYIQIDDGYQPAMGDWLETGAAFGGDVRGVLKAIRERGFEPAIWVAPFVAEAESHLFQKHPDWFVKDEGGAPLRSDKVTFGGWRRGPWYALDGTHPEAQGHLETVFRTMREEWGCTYFKLDANFWGAIHGGRFHDPKATRIEAYRRGMEAIRRGSQSAFLLGCNHPIWASLGLVHGSRSSNDIKRSWERIATTARQNLQRAWQNRTLWWNDPDALVLTGLPDEEARFHATVIEATGGMLLSGDDLTKIPADKLEMLRRLQHPAGASARFGDGALRVGVLAAPAGAGGGRTIFLLNWDDAPQTLTFELPTPHRLQEAWTQKDLGLHPAGTVSVLLPAHSGRVVRGEPAKA
jgi:alpha-galactosidase